jgi:peptide/nickel transport system permease protein
MKMKRQNKWHKILRTFLRNKTSLIGTCISLVVILLALAAPQVSPYDPLKQNVYHRLSPPEATHLMGTDEYGRDVLTRIFYGTRVSLIVGGVSVGLAMVIGTILGIIAGFKGGKLEVALMRFQDILMSFPDEVFGVMVMIVLGPGMLNVILAITILMIPRFARMAHAPTLAIKEMDFISSAKAIGAGNFRIITRHIVPNIFGDILVMGTLWLGTAIRLEASLSFLGVGVPPPTPTLGNMVRAGVDFLSLAPWISVYAGMAILVTVFGFNLLGDGLRDISDPKLYAR